MTTLLDTRAVPASDRADYWTAGIAEHFFPMGVESVGSRQFEARSRISDRENRRRPSYPAQRDRAQPDGAHALHEHTVPRSERRARDSFAGGPCW